MVVPSIKKVVFVVVPNTKKVFFFSFIVCLDFFYGFSNSNGVKVIMVLRGVGVHASSKCNWGCALMRDQNPLRFRVVRVFLNAKWVMVV